MADHFCDTATEFQTALNASVAGDTITLDHTVTFEGEFKVPNNKGVITAGQEIIIKSDTSAGSLPDLGYRTGPAYSSVLAKIQAPQVSSAQNAPALQFMEGSNGWIVRNVEFKPSKHGGSMIIWVGNNQRTYAAQPFNIEFDRCLIRGHALDGQRTGIYVEANNVKIRSCYISDIKGIGQDAYCIGVNNCRGPIEVTNCYLSGAGYCFIVGGSDPGVQTTTTVINSQWSTLFATQILVPSVADLSVGQLIAIRYADSATGGTLRNAHVYCTGIFPDPDTIPGQYIITHTALPNNQRAQIPGRVQWGCNFGQGIFRRNHLKKDLAWEQTTLPPVTLAAPTTGGGSIPVGTYYYVIQAWHPNGYQQQWHISSLSNERQVVVSAPSQVNLSWSAVTGLGASDYYRIYRYQKSGSSRINVQWWAVAGNMTTYADTNAAAGGTSIDNEFGNLFVVKNLWELKMGDGWQVDSNIMENCWTSPSTSGASLWLKSNNQLDSGPGQHYAQCKNVVFEWNLIRHVNGFFDISAQRASGENPANFPERMMNWTIRNNLMHDSTARWNYGNIQWGLRVLNGAHNIKIQHNTFLHQSHGAAVVESDPPSTYGYQDNLQILDNIMVANFYGIHGPFGTGRPSMEAASGSAAFTTLATGGGRYAFDHNIIGGTSATTPYSIPGYVNYPLTDMATFTNQFKDWDNGENGDYRLKRTAEGDSFTSVYCNAGTDGKDIGCDVATLLTKISGVEAGLPESSGSGGVSAGIGTSAGMAVVSGSGAGSVSEPRSRSRGYRLR